MISRIVVTVVGVRPQFIKCAMVSNKLVNKVNEIIIHRGQHYDNNISASFFKEPKIPKPKYNLNIGCESNTKITSKIMLVWWNNKNIPQKKCITDFISSHIKNIEEHLFIELKNFRKTKQR